jgi:hypothetical protein
VEAREQEPHRGHPWRERGARTAEPLQFPRLPRGCTGHKARRTSRGCSHFIKPAPEGSFSGAIFAIVSSHHEGCRSAYISRLLMRL